MLADWFTIAAQAVNFLILVWLMKRYLYKPVLNAIDEREKRIAAELANAGARKAEAEKEHDEFQHKNADFDRERAALLAKATEEAHAERQKLLDEARKAALDLTAKRQGALRTEENSLHEAIRRRTQQEVFAIARKALKDLAGTSLEARMVDVFVRRLHELSGEEKGKLAVALKAAHGGGVVRTTFVLAPAECAAAEGAIKDTLGAEAQVQFLTSPELIGGIEFTANGQKVAWSIADYLTSLDRGVDELLKETAATDTK